MRIHKGEAMEEIADKLREGLQGKAGYISVEASSNIVDSIRLMATKETLDQWNCSIFYNQTYCLFSIMPAGNKRTYTKGEAVTVELLTKDSAFSKFRKYTASPEKVVAKLIAWFTENN